jgi:hypothetical protein
MELIKCDFCGRIFKGNYLNKLKLSGLDLKTDYQLNADVCNDCAKDIYKLINKVEYNRK